jgi:broad specificity phosphatase PhoE
MTLVYCFSKLISFLETSKKTSGTPYFPERAQAISIVFQLYFCLIKINMKNFLLLFSFLIILSACTAQNSPKTIYIVRHAEKQLEGQDPELAYVGGVRAKKLAQILEKENIKRVLSTNFNRTRNTAQPTAAGAGVTVAYYDPKNQEALVADLRSSEGNILVVGHSNTVSQLANAFVGEGEKFADLTDLEYDFIYVVTLEKNGAKVVRKLYKEF